MSDPMRDQFDKLERAIRDFERASEQAVGFIDTIIYKHIPFNVSRRFVLADLSPLSFFHLVEPIKPEDDGAGPAVVRLYERLMPLLHCHHQWTTLKRAEDEHVRALSLKWLDPNAASWVCRSCTAYAFGQSLPAVGRALA